jgi:EAL domain-containing protein (putative c-di-GMP-specific phosphodiesterase class I)/GGDEF domain-containing protein
MLLRHLYPENEEARLNALRNLKLLDTPPSESFDRITRTAGRLLGAPVAAVSLTDRDRQWFKSKIGVDLAQVPREQAPCAYAIQADSVFVVPDMLDDDRFATSPLAQAGIRFYAGAPLITRTGYALGTLCIVDTTPRTLTDEEQGVLIDLANMVMTQIELQNSIGRVHPVSGHANEYQLLDDLEDLGTVTPGKRRTCLLVELVPSGQVSQGMRVLGANYVENLIRSATGAIRHGMGDESRLYHISPTRCAVLLDEELGRNWRQATQALDQSLRAPFDCGGIPVRPDPAMGVYEFTTGEVKPRDVLRRLYNAVDDARRGGSLVASYDERHDQAHARRFQLLSSLSDALQATDQFSLVYQPRVDVASGECVGAEALLRWHHPQFGSVPPGEFIPLVEETAHIRELTQWVLGNALAQVAAWRAAGLAPKVSINVSALNLEEDEFASRLDALLERHGVPPEAIELEFTESALARDSARVIGQLTELRQRGIDIAIDDFGTGYSSLAYMQTIPATVLKIDRAFVQALATSERDQKMVQAVIAMAHDLGYRVVAEGIETPEACALLAAWSCDEAQGYYFARPLPAAEMARWLAPR